MNISDLLADLRVYDDYTDAPVTFITADSRAVKPGCVFVCVKGVHFDGHTAAAKAQADGAVLIVAERDLGLKNQIIVPDTRAALTKLCDNYYGNPTKKLRLIGVTGTNGKTTTTFLIRSILEKLGRRVGLIGTVKNVVGGVETDASLTTPESWDLFRLFAEMVEAGDEFCVMEVSSQALAQQRVYGLRFEAAVFSNLTQDHLDYHGTFEAYAAAKAKLFAQADLCVMNLDDAHAMRMLADSDGRPVTYGVTSGNVDYRAVDITYRPTGVSYTLETPAGAENAQVGIPGEFTVYNSMAAAVTLIEMGFDKAQVLYALSRAPGVKGRIEVVPTDTPYTVIIDYAHSPDGLSNIIRSIRKIAKKRIITVFGCGGDRDRTKRPLMGAVVGELADVAVVTSDNPRTEDPDAIVRDILPGVRDKQAEVHVEVDRTKAIALAMRLAEPGDIIILAGKGHETYQIVGTTKNHYDEREIVRDILSGGRAT